MQQAPLRTEAAGAGVFRPEQMLRKQATLNAAVAAVAATASPASTEAETTAAMAEPPAAAAAAPVATPGPAVAAAAAAAAAAAEEASAEEASAAATAAAAAAAATDAATAAKVDAALEYEWMTLASLIQAPSDPLVFRWADADQRVQLSDLRVLQNDQLLTRTNQLIMLRGHNATHGQAAGQLLTAYRGRHRAGMLAESSALVQGKPPQAAMRDRLMAEAAAAEGTEQEVDRLLSIHREGLISGLKMRHMAEQQLTRAVEDTMLTVRLLTSVEDYAKQTEQAWITGRDAAIRVYNAKYTALANKTEKHLEKKWADRLKTAQGDILRLQDTAKKKEQAVRAAYRAYERTILSLSTTLQAKQQTLAAQATEISTLREIEALLRAEPRTATASTQTPEQLAVAAIVQPARDEQVRQAADAATQVNPPVPPPYSVVIVTGDAEDAEGASEADLAAKRPPPPPPAGEDSDSEWRPVARRPRKRARRTVKVTTPRPEDFTAAEQADTPVAPEEQAGQEARRTKRMCRAIKMLSGDMDAYWAL